MFMSRLDDLIKSLCPDGVKFRKIKEVCTDINTGLNPRKFFKVNTIDAENYYVTIREMVDGNIIFSDKTDKINDEAMMLCNNRSKLDENTVLFSGTGTIGRIVVLNEVPKNWNIKEGVYALHPIITLIVPKYLGYVLQSSKIVSKYMNYVCGGTVKSIPMRDLKNVEIPVPPLEIQKEIVHLLDDFTAKTAELQEELNKEYEARKKQYEYYVTRLFLNSESSWETMANIASFVYGYTDKAKDIGDTRFIRITDIDEQGNLKQEDAKYITMNDDAKKSLLSNGDLVMARTGATYGKTLYFEDETPSVYASFLIKIIPNNNKLLNKYYWYFTKTYLYWNQANSLVTTGGQPQFNTPALKQVKIPVPSLERQKVIIDALDIYENLYNVLQSKISSEIESRQKQYEFYRDKLLTFKESNESEVN